MPPIFDRILIANRGEIACRIARTCRRLGIHTIAIHSDADTDAAHVRTCDEAWRIGPAPAAESYLHPGRVLEAALQTGARAIHPGYGFLSENAEFAHACGRVGIPFIGPPGSAIDAMGNKATARQLMETAGVPLVPGYHGSETAPRRLQKIAERLGFPVLIKAVAGGGGKGMRRVDCPGEFTAALKAARREATAAFGSERVLIEKCLPGARHVEVQVLADGHGDVVHLFDRDCSLQRRYRKVIEEAPAPGLSADCRERMARAALRAARAIGHVGAGTVEFLVTADEDFRFLAMNTRLQVEHPVTEMIAGLDLVEWQIRIAAGQRLPTVPGAFERRGHAIQARICAQDPERDHFPAGGRIEAFRLPDTGSCVRVDAGVEAGDEVPVDYDPMIAKLIVHGENRADALRLMRHSLDRFHVSGAGTNLVLLRRLVSHPAWMAGEFDTNFIEEHASGLLDGSERPCTGGLAAACMAELLPPPTTGAAKAVTAASPRNRHDGRQPGARCTRQLLLRLHHRADDIRVTATPLAAGGYWLELPGGRRHAQAHWLAADTLCVTLDEARFRVGIVRRGDDLTIFGDGVEYEIGIGSEDDPDEPAAAARADRQGGPA